MSVSTQPGTDHNNNIIIIIPSIIEQHSTNKPSLVTGILGGQQHTHIATCYVEDIGLLASLLFFLGPGAWVE